jgi:hypothetical protein
MKLRLSSSTDIPSIMAIVADAQAYLASLNIDQWQDGYPDVAQIEKDIANQESYVVENNEGEIMATNYHVYHKTRAYIRIH